MTRRISIKPYQTEYLLALGQQLGTDDLTEVVAVVIADHRRAGITLTPGTSLAVDNSLPATADPGAGNDLLSKLSGVLADAF